MPVNLEGFGYNESADVTSNKTLTAADSGVVQNVTVSGVTITLPATATGLNFIIRNGVNVGGTVTVAPAAADGFTGNGYTATVNKSISSTNAGDTVIVGGTGTTGVTGYTVREVSGTWTRQA